MTIIAERLEEIDDLVLDRSGMHELVAKMLAVTETST